MISRRLTVHFGPVRPQPSWAWVGADVARLLAEQVDVRYFHDVEDLPIGAVAVWIKAPGSAAVAECIHARRVVLVFLPVDCFLDEAHIHRHDAFIRAARVVCLHAHSLRRFFPCSQVMFLDHYNKYGVAPRARRPGHCCLWIGAFQYVPYVLAALQALPVALGGVVLLTNAACPREQAAAQRNADRVGLADFGRLLTGGGVALQTWSARRQRQLLLSCRVAFDVKYVADFNQAHKPPTKIQKYLCSGIPCVTNAAVPHLAQLDGRVGLLEDLASPEYGSRDRAGLVEYGEALSARLTLANVAGHYLDAVLHALTRGS